MEKGLDHIILEFIRLLRAEGLPVGVNTSLVAQEIAAMGMVTNRNQFRYGLKALCCSDQNQYVKFDQLFDSFWLSKGTPTVPPSKKSYSHNWTKKSNVSLVYLGEPSPSEMNDGKPAEAKQVSGASHLERLKKTDFSKFPVGDLEELDAVAAELYVQLSRRLRKKLKQHKKSGILDVRHTIRSSMGQGGNPFNPKFKKKINRKPRLVVLLDMSGSMDTYSFYLLKFVFALQSHFELLESFAFSTSLIRITDMLKDRGLEETLTTLGQQVKGWSGGTLIGQSLRTFNEQYAKRILNGKSIVIVLSDGLETGQTEELVEQVKYIKQRTKKLIWLNPLKGMENYSPETKGMKAVLDDLDIFATAHNLQSLIDLENHLMHV